MSRTWSQGRISHDDDGDLIVRVGISKGTVVVDFGKPIVWLGLGSEECREFARKLNSFADELDQNHKPD